MSAVTAMRSAIASLEKERDRISAMLQTLYKAMPRRKRNVKRQTSSGSSKRKRQ